ncbi:uncharacterized protein LOC143619038 [Bidens hawaiensis]|uniref:uncharacterized protein LOC143619038 n=1 Tax=Bidens hawaiensis TaxID=980011 RepID=UPI00404A9607
MVDDLQENKDIGPSSNIPSTSSPSIRSKINFDDLPSDSTDRPPITSYHPNQIDEVRRAYLVKKAFNHEVITLNGQTLLVVGDILMSNGALKEHVGEVNSVHNNSVQKCDNLLNQKRSYEANVTKQSNEEKIANWYRLLGSIRSSRFLLENSLSFHGHNESEDSFSKGLFLAVLKLICENNPDIERDYRLLCERSNKRLYEEFKDDVFGLLADESRDVSRKEQMVIVVRYVDKRGVVKESLIGVTHINNTSSATLKEAIVSLLSNNQLSIDQVRGQGYDGSSNMRGKFTGLKALILRDNPSAHYMLALLINFS